MVEIINTHVSRQSPSWFDFSDGANQSLLEYLQRLQPLSVLDLGCGYPVDLLFLYHKFQTEHLFGVDNSSWKDRLERVKALNSFQLKDYFSFYEVYSILYKDFGNDRLSESEFAEWCDNVVINKEIFPLSEIPQLRLNYDVIIGRNILHYFGKNNMSILLNKVKEIAHQDSLVFFKVSMDQERNDYKYDDFKELLFENFTQGVLIEQEKSSATFISQEDLLDYDKYPWEK